MRAINIEFYPLMKKAGYGLPGKDAVVVWWEPWRSNWAALALVVYSEHLRYDFSISDGGSGYREETTSVLILDKEKAELLDNKQNVNLYEGKSLSHATAEIQDGRIIGISQDEVLADRKLGSKTSQDATLLEVNWRKEIK